MAVSCEYIKFFNSWKSFSFLSNAPRILKLKFYEIKNTVRVPSRMQLNKNPVFLHYFSKFMGILIFVLKYMYISLLLKMINGFSWPAKIMVSPFKQLLTKYQIFTILPQISHFYKYRNFSSIFATFQTNCFIPINFIAGTCQEYSFVFIFASCHPLSTVIRPTHVF